MSTSRASAEQVEALRCAAVIETYLDQYTASLRGGLPQNLLDAIRYALLGGGKRLRPVLVWHACAAAGGDGRDSLPAGAALELIHAFSLVHDDLPAMDNDTLRRGKPTLHIHAGEAMAILAGDAMIAIAFQHLSRSFAAPTAAALVLELSEATTAMISGQVYDTLGGLPPEASDAERVERIHRNKTGALIRAACRMGVRCADPAGDPGERTLAALTTYGEAVGLMFQIVDDLLDVEGTEAQTGKRTRKDSESGKVTYPGIHGVEQSRLEIERLHRAALAALEPLGPAADPLRELCRYLTRRSS